MELNEEEEFGLQKASLRESDPMEQKCAVKDHPDFAFLDRQLLQKWSQNGAKAQDLVVPAWVRALPIEKDPSKWTILEVQLRPDRSWQIIKELIATVCIGKGLILAEETSSSLLFRRQVAQDSIATGIASFATYQNLYVRIGVLQSKLRVLDIAYVVASEGNPVLNSVVPSPLATDKRMKGWEYEMDQLVGVLQTTIINQYLSLSHLFMASPENMSDQACEPELDEEYVNDVKKMFASEMKENMRQVCIPLEEYAYQQEFSCALLLGLLDPLLKKHNLKLSEQNEASSSSVISSDQVDVSTDGAEFSESSAFESETKQAALSNSSCYGELVNAKVHALWSELQSDCDQKIRLKIEEKQQQVTTRVQSAQRLRQQAIELLIACPEAEVTTLIASQGNRRDGVLLYEGNCIINSVPAKLNVTYGCVVYRTLVPFFASTTVISFQEIEQVTMTSALGIRMIAISTKPATDATTTTSKSFSIAMGLEVDLLYQLLHQIVSMQKQESATPSIESFVAGTTTAITTSDSVPSANHATEDVDAIIAAEEAEAAAFESQEAQ